MIPTVWVIRQYNEDNRGRAKSLADKSLEDILLSKDGFDLFASHLVKEFSTENLFFVFEMMQMKAECVRNGLLQQDDIGISIQFNEHYLEKWKRTGSQIYNLQDLKREVLYIIEQYIYDDSVKTVNISSFTRMAILNGVYKLKRDSTAATNGSIQPVTDCESPSVDFQDEFDSVGNEELFKKYVGLFDKAMKEVIKLLRLDSMTRFRNSKEYQILITENGVNHTTD